MMRKMNLRKIVFCLTGVAMAVAFAVSPAIAADPIKIGIIQGLSGPYEIYGKAEVTGFKMGLEYFTKGTNKIIGRDVKLLVEDTQLKAARAKMLLTKLYSDDKVDLAIGPTSSGVALAILPVAQQFKKILIVDDKVHIRVLLEQTLEDLRRPALMGTSLNPSIPTVSLNVHPMC